MAPCDAMAEIARLTEALRIMTLAKESCDVTLAANAEYQAQQLAELERCKRAVEWCLENGAMRSASSGVIYDHGCGCCSDAIQVPAEFADIIKPAAGGDGT